MKITKSHLRQIIKEELSRVLEQDSKGYKVVKKESDMFGLTIGFEGPDGEPLKDEDGFDLDVGDLMGAIEEMPGFFDIVNKDFLESHRKGSMYPYPDASVMLDNGFMPGKGLEDLLDLYVKKVLNK